VRRWSARSVPRLLAFPSSIRDRIVEPIVEALSSFYPLSSLVAFVILVAVLPAGPDRIDQPVASVEWSRIPPRVAPPERQWTMGT